MLGAKLFVLMGGTWLLEFVSWLVDEDHAVWLLFDMLNILRGPFYFYFFVVSNKKVRDSLLGRFCPSSTTAPVDTKSSSNTPLQLTQI